MMDDDSLRSYFGIMIDIVTDIKTCGGEKSEDEVIGKILKTYIKTHNTNY